VIKLKDILLEVCKRRKGETYQDYLTRCFGSSYLPIQLTPKKQKDVTPDNQEPTEPDNPVETPPSEPSDSTEPSTESNKRIPRKKGQHRKSSSHSDLYTDENPKGTIHGLKFATVKDAQKSVNKIKNSGKKHAHKIQAAVAMEQRAREMGKISSANVYRKFINQMKKITKKRNEK
jgi:hypothetical protein